MHIAFGVFAGCVFAWAFLRIAWVFLRISSSTPQNCATTNQATFENGHPLKVHLFVVMRFIASLRRDDLLYPLTA